MGLAFTFYIFSIKGTAFPLASFSLDFVVFATDLWPLAGKFGGMYVYLST